MEIFGYSLERKKEAPVEAFSPPDHDDGAVVVQGGGSYGVSIDLEGGIRTDSELITKYREMSLVPEVELAIDDIINEAIVNDDEEPNVKLNLDDLKQPDNIKKMIETEFDAILKLLEFNSHSYEIFKKWYIDGRIYYNIIIDSKDIGAGIQELRYIDPRKIRKIREVKRNRARQNSLVTVTTEAAEYFIYNEKGFTPIKPGQISTSGGQETGIKIAKDSIAHVTSGLTNAAGDTVLSYLHKAIKPLNCLSSLEDSLIIYRISRAPARRIFYVDVGNLPPAKAAQHLKSQMDRFKNKTVYDSSTGEIRDDRKFMTMLEDFWMPRRGDGKATEIVQLGEGQNLGNIEDILYFQKKLYRSLNVPVGRMDSENGFNIGRSSEITRDEVKFQKFIDRIRLRFSTLFTIILGKQLILKGIVTEEDWKEFASVIQYQFAHDNFFAELKDIEISNERMALVAAMDPFAGKYFSHENIRKNVLKQTDEDMKEEDELIKKEMDMEQYMQSFAPQMEQMNQDAGEEKSKPVEN